MLRLTHAHTHMRAIYYRKTALACIVCSLEVCLSMPGHVFMCCDLQAQLQCLLAERRGLDQSWARLVEETSRLVSDS
jgi:hypothetical protein